MVRILNNQELESVCDMPACIDALYQGIKAYSRGDAARRPRIDLFAPTSRSGEFACFSTMDAVVRGGYYALRIKPDIMSWPLVDGFRRRVTYCYRPGLYGGLILLFRTENAELVAIMNDGYIQHMRVGALAGLGARYLSRQDARTVGILGSGGMARSFALAFCAVRSIQTIKVYSPNPEHLRAHCGAMERKLGIKVEPMKNGEEVVRGSDIVAGCTNSMDPVIYGEWLEPGTYVSNVTHWEFDPEVCQKITLLGYLLDRKPLDLSSFSDDNFEIRTSVMCYIAGQPEERDRIPVGHGRGVKLPKARIAPCMDWKTEKPALANSGKDIAVLAEMSGGLLGGVASAGIQGLQFASVAGRAYELAAQRGLGKELSTELFLQDIPT